MKKKKSDKTNNSDLRNKAEKALNADAQPIDKLPDEEVRKLALELQVHQIELEMQNEELRNAHVELNKSHDEYISLYDFAPVGYLTISEKGLILRANLKFALMLSMECGSLIKKPFSRFMTRESADKYYLLLRHALETKEHIMCEVEMVKRDGTTFYAQLECADEQEGGGNVNQYRITITDISNLKNSEQRFRSMVSNIPGVVYRCLHDKHWTMEYISDAIEELVGYCASDFVGNSVRSFAAIIHPDDREMVASTVNEAISKKQPFIIYYRVSHKDGDVIHVYEKGQGVFDKNGETLFLDGAIFDITDKKMMEAAILQSEKMKSIGTITAGISHEFNNILNIISGNVQLLQMDYKDHHQLMNSLHDIEKSIDDGVSITDRMRDFTHPDTYADIFEPADINTLIEEAVKFTMPRWRSMAQVKRLDYNVDMEGMENVSSALCNPNEIEEVFIDIINNALDAMPDGGTLSFRTWSKDDTVFASITDTGKGMIEDVKKNIFDPFFTTRRPEGTGLGLSTSYTKMVKHGGKIEVDSEVGKGSTFTLQFPLTNKKENLITAPDVKQETVEKSLSILVVDDEDAIRDILNKFLSKEGHNVKTVDNGADAINMIEGEWFDLVLTDLSMPNVNGYEVITAINKLDKRPKLCLMTGWNEDLKLVADESGKVDFIFRKPFKLPELAKQINNLFSG